MQFLTLDDSEWLTTFPCRVVPYRDEWLVSVLLRCDEVNHWESGETFRYLLRETKHLIGPKSSLLVVPMPVLECLAQPLMISPECLLATTYTTELARLYLYPDPNPGLLLGVQYNPENRWWKPRSKQQETATERQTHLCPACIAQTRTLRRTVKLPYLQYCPIHHVAFQDQCVCGSSLAFFVRGRPPFTCVRCGLDWGQWPQIQMSPERETLEQSIAGLYEFFLSGGTEELKAHALLLARSALKGCESLELKLSGRRLNHPTSHNLRSLSLGYVVELLVTVGISLSDIIDDDIPYF